MHSQTPTLLVSPRLLTLCAWCVAGGLLDPMLQRFQGPALLVFNNATFSEHDFQSISRIGDSVKRKQTGKTGRFG